MMPNLDVVFEILTDMNGRVGALQNATDHSNKQRQVLLDKIEDLSKGQHATAMQVDRISVSVDELKAMRGTVEWVKRFRSYVMWALGIVGAAATTLLLSFIEFLKGLFRGLA
jgi:oligoribonuclease (3'-5' exoribonuclease)